MPPTLAWRLALLRALAHHYEGRLGAEAISNRGLVYYIGAKYRASPTAGLITLQTGVDPDKQGEMRDHENRRSPGSSANRRAKPNSPRPSATSSAGASARRRAMTK
ncbi:MAG: hypothetical protein R3C55_15845 [Parvularculaceae bacterium]